MARISNAMVQCAYDVGKKVYSGSIGRVDGSIEIARKTGMEQGSAKDYITVLLAMLDGTPYKRTINMYATEYYLSNIGTDFGIDAQKKAAQSTLGHVEYYKKIHGHLRSIESIAKKYI